MWGLPCCCVVICVGIALGFEGFRGGVQTNLWFIVLLFFFLLLRESDLALGAFGEQAAVSPSVVNRQYDVIERLKMKAFFSLLLFSIF